MKSLTLLLPVLPLLLLAAGCSRGAEETPAATEEPSERVEEAEGAGAPAFSFDSSGREVPATVILPAGAGEHPMVILLHGRAGMPFYGERLESLGRRLADAGIGAMIPSYFATTDDEAEPEVTDARFRVWRWALADAVVAAGELERVDADRIGVAGFSLGGFVAVTEAAGNPEIGAVAANYAGLSPYFPNPGAVERFPPLLVIHATGDPVVPLADAEALAARAREMGAEVETAFFPVETHVLEGEDWEEAAERMVEFFRRTLGGSRVDGRDQVR